ncbi:putative transporter [Posidoniimonas polymericola]|uniref:Putative transporter n=1 Tax=Posidoniimonas polymericola TaxID=2528002 RepID=A0A5C5ZEW5_9BACT|nr:MFS transporter [Posidoniimonas polymericola]TWT85862.1 putative transporter [Posidoniimonas polymericola]
MPRLIALYREAYSGLPRAVWLLAALIFVNRCGTMVLPFLAIYLKKVHGVDPALAIQFLAIYGLGGVAGAYLGGWLTERVGAMRVVLGSLLLSAPAYAALAACTQTTQFGAVLLYLSIAAETIRPAIATATSDHAPPELLSRAFALNRLAMNLGMSIGPAVGGYLAHAGLWPLLFSINGVFVLLSAVVTLTAFDLSGPAAATPESPRRTSLGGPFADRPFLMFLLLQSAAGLVFFQIISTLPMYLAEQYGLGEDQIGTIFVVNTALIVVFEMILTEKLRRLPPLRVVAVGTLLFCLGFGCSPFGGGFAWAVALAVVWTAGEMLNAPFGMTHVARRSSGRNRGAYMGLNSVSHATAFVGAPLVGGLLYQIDPRLPWWCCLGMAALLPPAFWALSAWAAPPAADRHGEPGQAA